MLQLENYVFSHLYNFILVKDIEIAIEIKSRRERERERKEMLYIKKHDHIVSFI